MGKTMVNKKPIDFLGILSNVEKKSLDELYDIIKKVSKEEKNIYMFVISRRYYKHQADLLSSADKNNPKIISIFKDIVANWSVLDTGSLAKILIDTIPTILRDVIDITTEDIRKSLNYVSIITIIQYDILELVPHNIISYSYPDMKTVANILNKTKEEQRRIIEGIIRVSYHQNTKTQLDVGDIIFFLMTAQIDTGLIKYAMDLLFDRFKMRILHKHINKCITNMDAPYTVKQSAITVLDAFNARNGFQKMEINTFPFDKQYRPHRNESFPADIAETLLKYYYLGNHYQSSSLFRYIVKTGRLQEYKYIINSDTTLLCELADDEIISIVSESKKDYDDHPNDENYSSAYGRIVSMLSNDNMFSYSKYYQNGVIRVIRILILKDMIPINIISDESKQAIKANKKFFAKLSASQKLQLI